MVIKSSGNVGIGTEDPDKKLDVDGDVKCDNIYLPETGKIYKNDVVEYYSIEIINFSQYICSVAIQIK
jgi:hypothetical protein